MPGTVRIRTNKNGPTYQARWRPPGDGRESERRTKTFKAKADAQQWLRDMETATRKGRYVDPRRGTVFFADVADAWLADKEHDVEPRTHSDYASTIRTWLTADKDPLGHRPPFRQRRVNAITSGVIEDWLRGIAAKRSHRTMAKTYGVLAQILKFATRRGHIASNPCANVLDPARRARRV
jgi:hypothetical protein